MSKNMIKPFGIKKWAEEDRPREKMLQRGATALSDSELLAILLSSGNKNETAVDLARRILKDVGDNLQKLSKHTVKSLSKYNGIGTAKAVSIIAALELGKRNVSSAITSKQHIKCSKDIYDLMYKYLHNQPYEHIWAIYLDRKNKILHKELIGTGGITETVLDPSRLFRVALDVYATGIVLCHNHPSGSIKPSREDIQLTEKTKSAAALFNMSVLDHLIIGENGYCSFIDEGIL